MSKPVKPNAAEAKVAELSEKLRVAKEKTASLTKQVTAATEENKVLCAKLAGLESNYIKTFITARPFEDKCVAITVKLIQEKKKMEARSYAYSLYGNPFTKSIGAVCFFYSLYEDGIIDACYELLDQNSVSLCRKWFPAEFIDILRRCNPAQAEDELGRMEGITQTPLITYKLASSAYCLGLHDCALRFLEKIVSLPVASEEDPESAKLKIKAAWFRNSIHALLACQKERADAKASGKRGIKIAVIDYKSPDYDLTSRNIGDYVQTLAMLGNLARFEYSGGLTSPDSGMLDFFKMVQGKIAPENRLEKIPLEVELVTLNRDFSSSFAVTEKTWMIAFGWHMHPHFKTVFDFPYPDNVRPLFISFHVNKREMLSATVVDYLRKYSPIGCRDWTTVYLLREKRIPAYFSGCITLTTNQAFGDILVDLEKTSGLAEIELLPKDATPGATKYTQEYIQVRHQSMAENLFEAYNRLTEYRGYKKIRTMRLHCYLPCASMGLNTTFIPRRKSDVRFEGIVDLEDRPDIRGDISSNIRKKIEVFFRKVFSGANDEEVYEALRLECEADLEAAERYCMAPPAIAEGSFDLQFAVGKALEDSFSLVKDQSIVQEQAVHVAFAFDANLMHYAVTTINSTISNSSGGLNLHLLTRGIDKGWLTNLAARFPKTNFFFYPLDHVVYGDKLSLLKHTSVATIDRLLIPELLQGIDKIVYLDVDIVVLADIKELYDTDLEGRKFAARSSIHPAWIWGDDVAYRIALRLDYKVTYDFRRMMHRRHNLHFECFNAGILVMDLETMRRDNFCAEFIPYVWRYQCNDQDVLALYVGGKHKPLNAIWNSIPSQELVTSPKIIHWVGPIKPWSDEYVLLKEEWEYYR